jgi:Pyridoxamine 5'-phosphate oxidase
MAQVFERIDDRLAAFLEAQPIFFVATAPLSPDGHVNCSPKGNNGAFKVLATRTVAYRDLTGSGIETVSHLRENARIVLMFCAFDGPPRIVRLHGRGRAVFEGEEEFTRLTEQFDRDRATRALIVVDVERISDSCGFGVPLMRFEAHRKQLDRWANRMGKDGLAGYRAAHNRTSLDGLPGVP